MNEHRLGRALLPIFVLSLAANLLAQPTYTVVPPDGGSIAASGSVVFTFSEPMDTVQTSVEFRNVFNPLGAPLAVTKSWNSQMTILTYTMPGGWPTSMFPGVPSVLWDLNGQPLDPSQDAISESGSFGATGGGGTETGSGTNRTTDFMLGKLYFYAQTNAAAPVADPDFDVPYAFSAMVTLASNRTASAISLDVPAHGTKALSQFPFNKEDWQYMELTADLETLYPQGTYTFTVNSSQSNQTVTVPFTITPQPPAPHIANFAALQTANPAQPITITWDAWAGGTANDYIHVSVGTNWNTPDFDKPNALRGNQTSVTIPAGTLNAGMEHDISIGFYRASWTTNTVEFRGAYRVSVTASSLYATGSGTGAERPTVGSAQWNGSAFSFEVGTTPGQTLTIETSPSLLTGSWTKYYTTNAPGSSIRVIDPRAPGAKLFYRVRNGS